MLGISTARPPKVAFRAGGRFLNYLPGKMEVGRRKLHSFNYDGKDGFQPLASLILDAAGNLYGTTPGGGTHAGTAGGHDAGFGGTVFELTPEANGTWTEKILHSFGIGLDGFSPTAGLIFDAAGNLYGTTSGGGMGPTQANGTVFELSPSAERDWAEKVLYNFGVPS